MANQISLPRSSSPPAAGMGKLIHSPEYLELRELPNAARKKARLTQAEVAERPGLPLSFVANYEGGGRSSILSSSFMWLARPAVIRGSCLVLCSRSEDE